MRTYRVLTDQAVLQLALGAVLGTLVLIKGEQKALECWRLHVFFYKKHEAEIKQILPFDPE